MSLIVWSLDNQGIGTLSLNQPEKLNVLSLPLIEEFRETLELAAVNDAVKAVIVTGSGKGFCAGADLGSFDSAGDVPEGLGAWVGDAMLNHFNPLMKLLHEFPKPIVSAINGIAAGGGVGVALCADVVIASRSASFKVVQVQQLDIVADLGANWLFARLAGRARALGACLLSDSLAAETLQQWGVIWECAEEPDLLTRAHEIANRLASVSPATVIASRRLIDETPETSFVELLEKERECQEYLCDQPGFLRRVRQFLER